MHFHLPKPLHGWREFAGEVGIIVIGVLIALGAEQVVENVRDREQVHQGEELLKDNFERFVTFAAELDAYAPASRGALHGPRGDRPFGGGASVAPRRPDPAAHAAPVADRHL